MEKKRSDISSRDSYSQNNGCGTPHPSREDTRPVKIKTEPEIDAESTDPMFESPPDSEDDTTIKSVDKGTIKQREKLAMDPQDVTMVQEGDMWKCGVCGKVMQFKHNMKGEKPLRLS